MLSLAVSCLAYNAHHAVTLRATPALSRTAAPFMIAQHHAAVGLCELPPPRMSTSLAAKKTEEASLAPVAVTALGGFLYFSTKRAAVKAAVVALTLFATVVTNAFGDKIAAYWRAVRARTDAQAAQWCSALSLPSPVAVAARPAARASPPPLPVNSPYLPRPSPSATSPPPRVPQPVQQLTAEAPPAPVEDVPDIFIAKPPALSHGFVAAAPRAPEPVFTPAPERISSRPASSYEQYETPHGLAPSGNALHAGARLSEDIRIAKEEARLNEARTSLQAAARTRVDAQPRRRPTVEPATSRGQYVSHHSSVAAPRDAPAYQKMWLTEAEQAMLAERKQQKNYEKFMRENPLYGGAAAAAQPPRPKPMSHKEWAAAGLY